LCIPLPLPPDPACVLNHVHLQLTAVGVNPANINFRAVTAESERYVTVREQSEAGNTVVIIDMAK